VIRLMVVDDHEPTRQEAIKELALPDVVEVIAQAETSDDAYKIAKLQLPDVVLLDLHLPGLVQIPDLIKRLVALKNCKVIMFASEGKAAEVQDLLDCGAVGYVLKTDQPALIRMAIIMATRGSKTVISPSLPRHITHLTYQERAILRHLTLHSGLKKAAQRMGISQEAVDDAINHLLEKLELEDADQLVKWAKKHGF